MEDFVFDNFGKLVVLAIAVLLVAGVMLDRHTCLSKWNDSGMQARWGMVFGCQVKRSDGTWIPTENLREVSP